MISKYSLLLIASVFIASCSQILLKKSSKIKYKSFIKEYLNWRVFLGYGMMFTSTILTILAFKGLEFKSEQILESMGYIFIMILSRVFLKEKITKNKIIGNALILLGIIVFYM